MNVGTFGISSGACKVRVVVEATEVKASVLAGVLDLLVSVAGAFVRVGWGRITPCRIPGVIVLVAVLPSLKWFKNMLEEQRKR